MAAGLDSVEEPREMLENSEAFREIVERIPQSITYVLSLFLICILIVLLVLGYVVRYPDVIRGDATLSSVLNSVRLVAPGQGEIFLNDLESQQNVRQGQVLAVVNSTANVHDIADLKAKLTRYNPALDLEMTIDSFQLQETDLGELTLAYFNYRNLLDNYREALRIDIYGAQIDQTKQILKEQALSLSQLHTIKATLQEYMMLERNLYHRDSLLYAQSVIAKADFEKSAEQYLQSRRVLQQAESDVLSYKSSVTSSNSKISMLSLQKTQDLFKARSEILKAYTTLYNQLEEWERLFAVIAPIDGQLEFLQFVSNNQFIPQGTELFSIIPDGNLNKVDVMTPSEGMGKVSVGQTAIVKLEDFPYNEYGSLKGKVTNISLTKIARDKVNYTMVTVALADNQTNYKLKPQLRYGMHGSVEIITDDKRLIQRLFERLKYLGKEH